MIADIVFEIIELALSIAKDTRNRDIQHDLSVEETLVEIAQRTAQAYEQHTGEPLDPSLIRPEEPIQ